MSTEFRPTAEEIPAQTLTYPASQADMKTVDKDNAMQRAGQPEELAPTYVYFASEDSSFITGAILEVTGG
jgi:NAD(P)-dependent dehydrogenase (short-subunit alcohol dehydrogenase family)